MVGIYKITNLINNHCYIGQSVQIERRWKNHKITAFNKNDKGYQYPLYRAIRKYGLENFSFEIIQQCSSEELNQKQKFWISKIKPEYNQTLGGDSFPGYSKLTIQQVQKIQNILIEDKEGVISHTKLAEIYGVHKDTIRDINVGRSWFNEKLKYPLHFSKFDAKRPKLQRKCKKCGKPISKDSESGLCRDCYNKSRVEKNKANLPVSREQLKFLIRTLPFTKIGQKYNVTDNAIRKWCDKFNLPRKVSDIKKYSDQEWKYI